MKKTFTNKQRFERNTSDALWVLGTCIMLTLGVAAFNQSYFSDRLLIWAIVAVFGLLSYFPYARYFPDKLMSKRGGIYFYLTHLVIFLIICIFHPLFATILYATYFSGFWAGGYIFWRYQLAEHTLKDDKDDDTIHKNRKVL